MYVSFNCSVFLMNNFENAHFKHNRGKIICTHWIPSVSNFDLNNFISSPELKAHR